MTASSQTPPTIGEVIAANIARRMHALGGQTALLAEATGIPADRLLSFSADAGHMLTSEWAAVASALGVRPSELLRSPDEKGTHNLRTPGGDIEADVDALRGVLDLMEGFADNDQRARYLLSSNWLRDRLARRQDDSELLDALRLRLREARA